MSLTPSSQDSDGNVSSKTYTYDQVFEASVKYFDGDDFAAKVFVDKYALQNLNGEYLELTPTDMHHRLAKEFARIESKYPNPLSEEEIFDLFDHFKFVIPQGSPMSAIGNPYQVQSLSNCFVIDGVHSYKSDSYGGIMLADQELAQIMKRRGGCGLDLSGIRPKGTITANAARTSDGIACFMERFSNTCREVAQCIAKDQLVLTNNGLKEIQFIEPSIDKVWTKLGWVNVINKIFSGEKKIYKIITNHGLSIKTSEDHIFLQSENHSLIEKKIKDFEIGDSVVILPGTNVDKPYINLKEFTYTNKHSGNNHSNRLIRDIKLPKQLDEKLAYVLGYMFGDGFTEFDKFNEPINISVACGHKWPKIQETYESLVFDLFGIKTISRIGDGAVNKVSIGSKIITGWLQHNNILKPKSHEIFIPNSIWNSSSSVQCAFLAGFFDADGYNSGKKKGYVFATVNHKFAKDIQTLLLANGIISKFFAEDRSEKGWRTLYSISITGNHAQTRFVETVGALSVKVRQNIFIAKRDNNLTPYNGKSLAVNGGQYGFIPDNSHYISANAYLQLPSNKRNSELLLRSEIISIEEVGLDETYDLILEKEHLFWCEGFYVHNSGRRGAEMQTISVNHPDIETFINIKQNLKKVTGANISIRLTDEFMYAVKNDQDYTLRWPVEFDPKDAKITKIVRAKDIWDQIVSCAWASAEPGLLFWDTVKRMTPSDLYSDVGYNSISTNPCISGETLISVADGRDAVSIKQLADEGKDVLVNSINPKTNSFEKKLGRNPRITGTDKKLLKIILEDNSYLNVTENHNFLLSNGEKIEAKNLKINDILFGFITFPEKEKHTIHNYIKIISIDELPGLHNVYNITVDDNHTYGVVTKCDIGSISKTDKITTKVYDKLNGVFIFNCGEIILSKNDSCKLLILNLSSYVKNSFLENSSFDFKKFKQHVTLAQRLMDDIVDLEIECIDKIINKIKNDPESDETKLVELNLWNKIRETNINARRTGLGITALGDCLAALNIKYGSPESIKMTGKIYRALAVASHTSSCIMAKERGAFPIFDYKKEKDHEYLNNIMNDCDEEIVKMWKKTGRRNIANTTTAPTGSVSALTQTTSGIEPVFLLSYTRRKKHNPSDKNARIDFVDAMGDSWQEFTVYHHGIKKWMNATSETNITKSPYHGATSAEIDWISSVEIQAAAQKSIDHSISKTVNLPELATKELVSEVYMKAWESGCKGITIYRDKCRTGVLISSDEAKSKKKDGRPLDVESSEAPKRPTELPCDIKKVKINGEAWTIFVGLLNGKPYEIFGGLSKYLDISNKHKSGKIIKNGKIEGLTAYNLSIGEEDDEMLVKDIANVFENPNFGAFTRTISLALRHGTPVQYVVEQLLKDKHSDITSFSKVMSRVLKQYIKDGSKSSFEKKCPECGKEDSFVYQEGCLRCISCSYSKCG